MDMIDTPITTTRRTNWLDVPVARLFTVNRAVVVLVLILVAVAFTRFWHLGERALHHDESLHAVYSYYLYDRGDYVHQPLMHGPVLFHLTALGYWLFGATDTTARLVPALLGIFIAWFPWKFRQWIGTSGALVTSFLLLISPSILYYSRFIREDIFIAAWTLVIIYGLWAYLQQGKLFHLGVMTVGWALAFCQKENSYMIAFYVWVFMAIVVAGRLLWQRRDNAPKVPLRDMREWHLVVMLGALFLPLVTPAILYALHLNPGAVGGNSETSVYNSAAAWPMQFNLMAYGISATLAVAGFGLAAWLWNARKYAVVFGIFWLIFALFYTTFLTNPYGFGSGLIGSLGYWIEQHGVERGAQPWYYYMMLLPLYEFLPLLFGLLGSIVLMLQRKADPLYEGGDHLSAKGMWLPFNLWWFLLSFGLLSFAGEKMPWLLIHITLPLIFLTGWVVGKIIDDTDWSKVFSRQGIVFGLLFTLTTIAFLQIVWLLLTNQLPFRGTDELSIRSTLRWGISAILLLLGGWFATTAAENIGGKAARHVATYVLGIFLVAATVRYAVIVTYINSDTPNEPLIFVQSSPSVTMISHDLAQISERLTGGNGLKIAYDSHTSWPFDWYLRNYPNRFFFGSDPAAYADQIKGAEVVLAGSDSDATLKTLIPTYVRFEYPMRWWFFEDYKNLEMTLTMEPDPNNPGQNRFTVTGEKDPSLGNVLRNLALYYSDPTTRDNLWDFVRERKVKSQLGGENFIVYIKPELAAQIWQYGGTEALTQPNSDTPTVSDTLPGVLPESYAAVDTGAPAIGATLGGDGSMASVRDVAVLTNGTVAVLDGGNHRVRLYGADGTLMRDIGGQGEGQGQLNDPWGIAAAPDGSFYVSDTWNHRIQHFDSDGTFIGMWGSFADTAGGLDNGGTFWGPRDVAVDSQGNVYVTDTGNKRVEKFDATGGLLQVFGGNGSALGQLQEPVGIAVGPDDTVYVADTWNRRIQQFSPDGQSLSQIPIEVWAGQSVLNKPYITVGDESLWVSDPEGNHILQFDLRGQIQRVWGSDGSLRYPFGLTFADGSVWVADSENGKVVEYELE